MVQEIVPILIGIGNHNYFVRDQDANYVVKFLITQSLESIANDIAIQDQLTTVGIVSPKYVTNKHGESVYRKDSLTAVVSKKIEGTTPLLTDKQLAYNFGKLLAQFHTQVTTLPFLTAGWMQPKMEGLQTTESDILYQADLPRGITHGDMHLSNVLVEESEKNTIVALFNFEEIGEDLLVLDLARSILGVCCNEAGDTLVPSLIREEIAGYESIRKLSYEEKQVVPTAIKYAGEACIKWFKDHGYEKYIEHHRKRITSIGYT